MNGVTSILRMLLMNILYIKTARLFPMKRKRHAIRLIYYTYYLTQFIFS